MQCAVSSCVALKSFGLCATLCKLGIPIPVDKSNTGECNEVTRVDYFENIFIDLGDSQSVSTGYSTLMAKLNTCSRIIKCIEDDNSSFVDGKIESNCPSRPLCHSLIQIIDLFSSAPCSSKIPNGCFVSSSSTI
jgi:hypothetical protein